MKFKKFILRGTMIAPILAFFMAIVSEPFYVTKYYRPYYQEQFMILQYILDIIVFVQAIIWVYHFRGRDNNLPSGAFGVLALLFNPFFFNPSTDLQMPIFREGLWDLIAGFALSYAVFLNDKYSGNNFLKEKDDAYGIIILDKDLKHYDTCKFVDSDVYIHECDIKNDINMSLDNNKSWVSRLESLFSFSGRIGKKQYAITTIGCDLIGISMQIMMADIFFDKDIMLVFIDKLSENTLLFTILIIFCTVVTIIKFSAITRRVHDIGRGGMWSAAAMVLSRNIFIEIPMFIYLSCKDGESKKNKYGIPLN